MDLEPFTRINPCGFEGLEVAHLASLVHGIQIETVVADLQHRLVKNFSNE
jgi:lipoate-protein ligase B